MLLGKALRTKLVTTIRYLASLPRILNSVWAGTQHLRGNAGYPTLLSDY
jgi:hypothetical protein